MAFEIVAVNSHVGAGILVIGVNPLKNGLKISYHTEGDFLELNLSRIDEKRGY